MIIHDWVPVRTPEGEVTLYDRVDGTTAEHAGTGHLIAGPSWAHEGPVVIPPGTVIIFPLGQLRPSRRAAVERRPYQGRVGA